MKKILSLLAVGLALSFGTAHAADGDGKTKQQSKMASCNADEKAKTLKGDERKAFMKSCLSAKPEAEGKPNRMAACNADAKAKTLKGDERKAFMKECLSNK